MITRRVVAGAMGAGLVVPADAQAQAPTPLASGPVAGDANIAAVGKILDAIATPPPSATPAPPPDVSPGSAPLVRDQAAWARTVAAFHSLYGPIPQREGTAPGAPAASANDPKLVTYSASVEKSRQAGFRYNHVEVLLDQASTLLDRCLSVREIWVDKAARAASFAMDVSEFFQNDAIHQEEIAQGIYTTPYIVSNHEWEANQIKAQSAGVMLTLSQGVLDNFYFPEAINKTSVDSQALSWMSVIPNYKGQNLGEPLNNSFAGVAEPAAQRAINSAGHLSFRSLALEQLALIKEQNRDLFNKTASAATAAASAAKRDWDSKDIDFKRRRTQVARDAADYKVLLSTIPNGAFNYSEQIGRYKRRFNRDFMDALARVTAADKGLKLLYNYKTALPASVTQCVQSGNCSDVVAVFEDLVEWVRDAVAFLVAFGEQEQSFTRTVSVKQLSNWMDGIKSGTWTFAFDQSLLGGLSNVRVRGVNLYIRGISSGFWDATLTAPRASTIKYIDGGTAALDQSSFPRLRLGRVGYRADLPFHEVYGVTSLRNAAPFGTWQLTLGEQSTERSGRASLSDIDLDIELVARQ